MMFASNRAKKKTQTNPTLPIMQISSIFSVDPSCPQAITWIKWSFTCNHLVECSINFSFPVVYDINFNIPVGTGLGVSF